MPEIDLVAIDLEDLVFGKRVLNLNREKYFLNLAAEAAFRREKQILGELHCQGRSTLCALARGQIAVSRADHAKQVHAPVVLKILVFDRDDRLTEQRGEVLVAHRQPSLKRE